MLEELALPTLNYKHRELAVPPILRKSGGYAPHSPGGSEVVHGPLAKKTFVLQETDIARRHGGKRFSLLAL